MIDPIFSFHLFGVTFFMWKTFEFEIDALDTAPYAPNGEIPMLFFRFAWFELIFENKYLYKKIFKMKYKYEPEGL